MDEPGPPPEVVGAVLAGGASRRMGRPKALIEIDGVPMARRAADALIAAGCETVVLLGGDPSWGPRLDLVPVPDRWPGEGPLAALATALLHATDRQVAGTAVGDRTGADSIVVITACDQPWLRGSSLAALVAGLTAAPAAAGAVAVGSDGRRQPFPSAWRSSFGPAVAGLVDGGTRRVDAAFALGPLVEVPVEDAELADVDAPGDLP